MTAPEIIVFGGSFDPPHQGHRKAVEKALAVFPTAKAMAVPAYAPVRSAGVAKPSSVSYEHRVAMTKLLMAASPEGARIAVSRLEERLEPPSYSFKTLSYLQKVAYGRRLALLIGDDQLANFASWHAARDILCNFNVVVVARSVPQLWNCVEDLAAKLGLAVDRQQSGWQWSGTDTGGYLLTEVLSPASSSAIRKNRQRSEFLTDEVSSYIDEHRLYL